ncbi:MAG: right-handed parallel beta-helix repeat-containing protein, partial [Candidatus Thorarchaeota archaeon]
MQKGRLQKHRGSALLLVFLLGIMLFFSVPEVTSTRQNIQKSESTEYLISKPVLDSIDKPSWAFPLGEIRSDFQWAFKDSGVREISFPITMVLDLDPFGTPHGPIYIDENSDFETQGWPGEGSVEQPYIISDLNINSTSIGGPAINITNTDVHFFIKDCWLTANETTVIELNSVSHGRVKNNTILDSERGVVALNSDDLTIFDNLFYSFSWAGVYLEDCLLAKLDNNNCTTCFVGIHVEQSSYITIEDNYGYGCLSAIEVYLNCESVTVYNNTAISNDVGIGVYLDCRNNIINANNCTQNNIGILSENSYENDVTNNFGRLNYADILLENCTSYTITGNNGGMGVFDM